MNYFGKPQLLALWVIAGGAATAFVVPAPTARRLLLGRKIGAAPPALSSSSYLASLGAAEVASARSSSPPAAAATGSAVLEAGAPPTAASSGSRGAATETRSAGAAESEAVTGYSGFPRGETTPVDSMHRIPANLGSEAKSVSNGPRVAREPARGGGDSDKSVNFIKNIWDTSSPVVVQGESLRTWSFTTARIERVQVLLRSDGRPLHSDVELWQGPDNIPMRMSIYNEDGNLRPFSAVIETPWDHNTIAIRNSGHVEFPLYACVEADVREVERTTSAGLGAVTKKLASMGSPKTIQGGSISTFPFDSSVASVQILLQTDGRPLHAKIELLQGPNNNKQVVELYSEDGTKRPFFAVIETPGSGNVIRIVNTAPMEFPLSARVEAFLQEKTVPDDDGDHFIVSNGQMSTGPQLQW